MQSVDASTHALLAKTTYNQAYTLSEKVGRTVEEDIELQRLAYTSAWHWKQVGGAKEEAIAEWFISRVSIMLGQKDQALFHAQQAHRIANGADVPDWLTASTLEGLARALAANGQTAEAVETHSKASEVVSKIEDPEDREHIQSQLDEEPWFDLFVNS